VNDLVVALLCVAALLFTIAARGGFSFR
jgi:hypothetical protein